MNGNAGLNIAFDDSGIPFTEDSDGNSRWDGFHTIDTNWRTKRNKELNPKAIEIGRKLLLENKDIETVSKEVGVAPHIVRFVRSKIDPAGHYSSVVRNPKAKWFHVFEYFVGLPSIIEIPLREFGDLAIDPLRLRRNLQSMLGANHMTCLYRWSTRVVDDVLIVMKTGDFVIFEMEIR